MEDDLYRNDLKQKLNHSFFTGVSNMIKIGPVRFEFPKANLESDFTGLYNTWSEAGQYIFNAIKELKNSF